MSPPDEFAIEYAQCATDREAALESLRVLTAESQALQTEISALRARLAVADSRFYAINNKHGELSQARKREESLVERMDLLRPNRVRIRYREGYRRPNESDPWWVGAIEQDGPKRAKLRRISPAPRYEATSVTYPSTSIYRHVEIHPDDLHLLKCGKGAK